MQPLSDITKSTDGFPMLKPAVPVRCLPCFCLLPKMLQVQQTRLNKSKNTARTCTDFSLTLLQCFAGVCAETKDMAGGCNMGPWISKRQSDVRQNVLSQVFAWAMSKMSNLLYHPLPLFICACLCVHACASRLFVGDLSFFVIMTRHAPLSDKNLIQRWGINTWERHLVPEAGTKPPIQREHQSEASERRQKARMTS